MNNKKEAFIRINSRISRLQHAFIKAAAKKLNISEGELHRKIIEEYITSGKKSHDNL